MEGMGQLVVELCATSKRIEEAVLMTGSDNQLLVEAADCGPPFSAIVKEGPPNTLAQAASKSAAAGSKATNPHAAMLLVSQMSASSANPHAGFLLSKHHAPAFTASKVAGKQKEPAITKPRGRPPGSKDTQPRKKRAQVKIGWHYGGKKGPEGMTLGDLSSRVTHDVLGEAFLVAQVSPSQLMLQIGEGEDGSVVTVEAREVQATLAAAVITEAGTSSSAKTSAGAPRPNRKKGTPRAPLSSEIGKTRIFLSKAQAQEVVKRKRREATAAKKGRPLKDARAQKNRRWPQVLKDQAVELYHSRFATVLGFTECAKDLELRIPGFKGVSAAQGLGFNVEQKILG